MRVTFGARHLLRIARRPESHTLGPDLIERGAKDVALDALARLDGNRVQARVFAIDLVQLARAWCEQCAAAKDLHFDAKFEHVRSRGHDDVGEPGIGQHRASNVGCSAFPRRLVDRPGDDVVGAQSECRRDGFRITQSTGGADAHRTRPSTGRRQVVAQAANDREEHGERSSIGMPTRVGLARHIVGNRNQRREPSFLSRECAIRDQLVEQGGRRRLEKMPRHFGAADLRHDTVRTVDSAPRVHLQSGRAVSNDGRRELHERRRLNARDSTREVAVHEAFFERRFVRRMDQVGAPRGVGCIRQRAGDGVESFLGAGE